MSFRLKVTINVIKRRFANGEELDMILKDYPKLSAAEIEIIKVEVQGQWTQQLL